MSKDVTLVLDDILDAIAAIRRLAARDREDEAVYCAVERHLITIGEAVRLLPDALKEKHAADWVDMVGMRNYLVHVYWRIDHDVVWQTVDNDLPELQRCIEAMQKD